MIKTIAIVGVTGLVLAAVPLAALAQTANATSPSASSSSGTSNPGTPPSGGKASPTAGASASDGTTPADRDLEKQNDKVQSICKGC